MNTLPEIQVTEIEEIEITETPKGWDSVEGWFPCAECGERFEYLEEGGICDDCFEYNERIEDEEYDESMDGDFDSAMTSAGWGTDEDYGYFGNDD